MDYSTLIAELKSAQAAIESAQQRVAIALQVATGKSEGDNALGEQEGVCKYCEKPLFPKQKKQRGLHISCYNDAYARYVKSGKYTIKQLEEIGLFAPVAKRGRKPREHHDSPSAIKELLANDGQTSPKLTSEKTPKPKAGKSQKKKTGE